MPDRPVAAETLPRLRMRGIHKRFGATIALAGVDLEVYPGEVLALVGENGAGKSTLMKVLSGAHPADGGEMWLDGAAYRPRDPLEARRAGVAMIYQELALAGHLSVSENILLGMEPTYGPIIHWTKARRMAGEAMAAVGRPDIPLETPVHELSVAERQLVEIARAVAIGCRVLVLDEPTSSLAKKDIACLFTLVNRLKRQGHAIVYISHFLEEVKEISDRFTVLRDGQSVGSGITAEVTEGQLVTLMVGRTVADLYPHSAHTPGEIVLEIHGLQGHEKPRSATLALHRGEVVGIAGLVGAGRTELLRTIFGLDAVRGGRIRVASHLGPASPARRWQQGVGIVSEDRKSEGLALGLSMRDNLTLSRQRWWVSPARAAAACETWIQRLAIRSWGPEQEVGDLSGGNQQKVALARLLHHEVDILLLDEPTRGIDVGSKAQIYQMIDELARSGKTILMVSSYLPELMGVCDRIAVMCRGVLGTACETKQWTEHEIMREATGAGETGEAGEPE